MHGLLVAIPVLALSVATAFAQPGGRRAAAAGASTTTPLVEFEMMTWPEVRAALAAGKTTALVYTGGTEQRGPQNVNGGHTLMARATVKAIALKLGNAIAMPVLPYAPNQASAELPGTIGLSTGVFGQMLTEIAEQSIVTGFRNVVLMGDHGGGQPTVFAEVARKLDEKYSAAGIHVYYCDDVYKKANDEMDGWLVEHGYPLSSHAGIPDTSTMLYLGGDRGWVRTNEIKNALGDPLPDAGQGGQERQTNPSAPPLRNNGVVGDGRRSSAALGKRAFDIKVDAATRQIQGFLAAAKKTGSQPR